MSDARTVPPTNVTVVVVVDGSSLPIARVRAPRCDLTLIAELLRLRLHARRLGWNVELRELDDRLRDLLEFIGFRADGTSPTEADVVDGGDGEDQSAVASRRGGRPNSANSSG